MELEDNTKTSTFKNTKSFSDKKNIAISYLCWKICADLLLGVCGAFLSFPIILISGLAIKMETKGPVFFMQKRVGAFGKEITIIKLRTMVEGAEKQGEKWAQKDDPRITRVGNFLRKHRIDELPQFINVLKGDLSIIGPRPEVITLTQKFTEENPNFPLRLQVKPGITGWAQVNGGYDLSPNEKLIYDLHYIDNQSMKLDITIMLHTVRVIFMKAGAR